MAKVPIPGCFFIDRSLKTQVRNDAFRGSVIPYNLFSLSVYQHRRLQRLIIADRVCEPYKYLGRISVFQIIDCNFTCHIGS